MTLTIRPWVIVMIQLCDILSRSNMVARSYGLDTVLGMCALWPWPWRYDLGLRSWHTLGSWTTIVWNIIRIQLGSEELWPRHRFWVCVYYDLDLGDMTLGQVHDTPLGYGHQLCEISWHWGVMARTWILGMCVLWPWPRRYDLGSGSWHTLGLWARIV